MAAMLTLGNSTRAVVIDAPFYQAGLAGYSDAAMRMVARRHGCPYCITEAMLDQFLINGGKGLAAAELGSDDHPIAGQLMGSHPADIAAGAKVLVGLGYDVVDVNLACPVKKIKRKARGGHLLSAPEEARDILHAVASAVGGDVPLTVKLRRAYDDTPGAEAGFRDVLEAAIDAGFAGATVHGRTVEQKYVGPSRWAALRRIVDDYGDTPGFTLGGSGDIWTAPDIFRMIRETGVAWVSVARGCIGNPWIFRQARALMAAEASTPGAGSMDGVAASAAMKAPTIHEQRDVLREHFELSVGLHGESQASRMMRKFGIKFSRHHPAGDAVKDAFIRVRSLDEWAAVLDTFYAVDGPGRSVDDALPDEAEPAACEPIGAA